MQEIKEYTTSDGWHTADVNITKDEWLELLNNEDVIRPVQRMWLLRFYGEANHQSSCYLLGKKYNSDPSSINANITNCGRAIQKHLGKFSVISNDADGTQKHQL